MVHKHIISQQPTVMPNGNMPDGAVTGNGDLAVIWGGSTSRVHLYISKVDFWNADEHFDIPTGASPIGIVEILMPHFTYAPYEVDEMMDDCKLVGVYKSGRFDSTLTVITCATENTILIEEDRSAPGLSTSFDLLPLTENATSAEKSEQGGIQCITRRFDTADTYYPTEGLVMFRQVSCKRYGDRERIRYAITVGTNHDSAAFKKDTEERLRVINDYEFDSLVKSHERWWKQFWSKCSVRLHDELMENMWYTGLYMMACTSRNRSFAPGIWGNFTTSDRMWWGSDYHLDYNYELPFVPLISLNHPELVECYAKPLLDFLPRAKRYAQEFFGCRGAVYPVTIGPLGCEMEVMNSNEHRHMFCGQKSDGVFGGAVLAMKWFATRDLDFAREVAYPYLIEQANFWEDYLVYEDGKYVSYNDSSTEVMYWCGPDYKPQGHDHINSSTSICFLRMTLKALLDMTKEMGIDEDRRAKWQDILDKRSYETTTDESGHTFIANCRPFDGSEPPKCGWGLLWYIYLGGEFGYYTNREWYDLVKYQFEGMHEKLYDNPNCFTKVYATAARMGEDPDFIFDKYKQALKDHMRPNGLVNLNQGGMEQCTAALGCIGEMFLQSYENIIRLFPCWNYKNDASFTNMRAYGAFVVSAEIKDGEIHAEITSEKGLPLSIAKPASGEYVLVKNGERIPLTEEITTVETSVLEKITVARA